MWEEIKSGGVWWCVVVCGGVWWWLVLCGVGRDKIEGGHCESQEIGEEGNGRGGRKR